MKLEYMITKPIFNKGAFLSSSTGRLAPPKRPVVSNGHFEKLCVFLSHSRRLPNGRSVNSQFWELTDRPFELPTDFPVTFLFSLPPPRLPAVLHPPHTHTH